MLVDNVLTQLAVQIQEGNSTQAEIIWSHRVSHAVGRADGEYMLHAFHFLLAYQKAFVLSLSPSSWRQCKKFAYHAGEGPPEKDMVLSVSRMLAVKSASATVPIGRC